VKRNRTAVLTGALLGTVLCSLPAMAQQIPLQTQEQLQTQTQAQLRSQTPGDGGQQEQLRTQTQTQTQQRVQEMPQRDGVSPAAGAKAQKQGQQGPGDQRGDQRSGGPEQKSHV
jgi:hypothetical protein